MKKRITALLLLIIMFVCGANLDTVADDYNNNVFRDVGINDCNHVDGDGNGWCDECEEFCVEEYTVLNQNITQLSGNILVSSEINYSTPLVISGETIIYLADDALLNARKGIVLNADNSLTLNAQVSGKGGIVAYGEPGAAGIGGSLGRDAGDLTVNNGIIQAQGGYGAAGIGGSLGKNAGKVIVNGGNIGAQGGYGAKAIGGGFNGADGIFIQNGGILTLQDGDDVPHRHTFESDYTFNDTHHWYACTCGHTAVEGFGEHDYDVVTTDNVTTYSCKICDYTKKVYKKPGDDEGEIITEIYFTGISLTLGSDISVNFYMNLTDIARQNGSMTFAIGDRIVTVDGSDAKYNENEQKYFFSTPLTVLEMNENITATFSCNGVDYVQEYSVWDYIEAIVVNPTKYGEKAVALAKKIANYGHYEQIYLASIHSNVTIGKDGYAQTNKFSDADVNVSAAKEALANYSLQISGESDSLSLYGSTVFFDSATSLNYYITVNNNEEPEATAVNTVTGESKHVEINAYKNNIYTVSVKNITATELADDIAVTVNGELIISGSVFAYCNSVISAHSFDGASEKDLFAVKAMAAFYEYYLAAIEYTSFEVCFVVPGNYRIFTADGKEEIQKEVSFKCYRSFSFRIIPDEGYEIYSVFSEGDVEFDESGFYTVSFIGGIHDIMISVHPVTVSFLVNVVGEDSGISMNTRVSFEYGGNTVNAFLYGTGTYLIENIPKGTRGTIVVSKPGFEEYRIAHTADGLNDEITVELTPSTYPE